MTIQAMPYPPHAHDGQRRVSGVWAAVLSLFFGWGMGHFYAGRTKTALALTAANLGAAFVGTGILYALSIAGAVPPPHPFALPHFSWDITIGLPILSIPFAVWAWIAASRQPFVPEAGPMRLLGYLALYLAPILIWIAFGFVTGIGHWSFNPWTGRWG